MYKYNGLLVHQSHDDDGIVEVIERGGVRSLHFGSAARQSSMKIAEPYRLELDYARAMSCWLLFQEGLTSDALLVGLGGGSLAKHLLYHFPDCHLDAVEYRQSVVKIARSHFGLPLDRRLKIIMGDGAHYMQQRQESHAQHYSLMFIDAFDHEGMAPSLCNEAFFKQCKTLLQANGLLLVNLWGGMNNKPFQDCAMWLSHLFDWRVLFLPVRGKGNIIAIGFNDASALFSMKALKERALDLEHQYQIEFPVFLKDLTKHNASVINNVIKP
jgi:spermidine synthase